MTRSVLLHFAQSAWGSCQDARGILQRIADYQLTSRESGEIAVTKRGRCTFFGEDEDAGVIVIENRRYYRLVRDIMRAIDWLKPLRNAKVFRSRKVTRRSRCEGLQLAGELLEARQLLSGINAGPLVNDADGHDGHSHAASESFYLPPQRWLTGNGALLSGPAVGTPLEIATNYLTEHASELGLDADDLGTFVVSSQYSDESNGTTHLYLRQTFEGLEVQHADLSISLTARGEVIHVASSFVSDPYVTENTGEFLIVSASEAFMEWSDDQGIELPVAPRVVSRSTGEDGTQTVLALDGTPIEDVGAKLVFIPTANGLERAWQLDVHDADYRHWFTAYVSATDGDSVYTNSNVEFATYNVFAFPTVSPITGTRSNVVDPHDSLASPYGWHDTNGVAGAEFTDTRGNNATVQEDGNADNAGGFRPDGGANLVFDFPLDTAQDPALYQSAAITNAYYWVNLLHDIHYQYGFTEAAGNFQVNNYGRGGLGNDPVIVDIQDGDGGSDSFAALPDGQSPRMSLYKRDNPYRDRAYDSDILIHEFGHGVSERLTGGPGNTTALNAVQSKGMGEGWSDWWALMLTQVSTDAKLDAYPVGNYAAGFAPDGPGIRAYPYSFDKTIDPLTYGNFNGGAANNQQHKAGTIWASALWDMNWLLIDKYGFSPDMLHGNGGNNLAMRLVMDGLKLQGTNPSFLAGRDAILAADVALTGGANQAEIWQAFARRGMGLSANDGGGAGATTVVEAFDLPAVIRGTVFRDDNGDGTQNGNEPGLGGRPVYLDKNNNGVQDVPTTTTFTQTPNGSLPDAPNIRFTKVVSGLSGVITDINLTVNVTHPNVGDLYITLFSPANTPVILSNYLGDSGDNYTNTTFDDEAPIFISQGAAPFTGSFKPYFNLSMLDGRDPNGTWTLRFDDRAAGNTGTLVSWSLQISSGTPDPVTMTDSNGDYTFFGLGNATHHVRDVVPPGFSQTAPANGVRDVVIANGQSAIDQDFGLRALANVSQVATLQDTLSPPIFITPPENLGATSFRISGITNGSLFKSDGTTPVTTGAFITLAEGAAGLRFMPSQGSTETGRFEVELSANGSTIIPDTSKAFGNITVGVVGSFSLNKSGVTVTEAGSTEIFTAVLNSQPLSNVVLSVTSTDLSEASVSPTTLTFTPANWNVAQTVTVTGVNDALDDGDIVSNVVVAVIDAQSDDAFDPAADKTIAVTTTDNDQSGFTIVQTDGAASVTEAGSTDSFAVTLNAQPTSNVVLSVTSGDTTEATVGPVTLTFTLANWNVAQSITVTGVDDGLDDGDIVSNVTVSVVDASSDNTFDPLPDQTVAVTTIDNDGAGFVIVESGGSTVVTEAKTLDSFTVALTAQPTSNVVIKVTHATVPEPDFSPSTLTFTSANWNTPQTVYVRGVDDLLDDGDIYSALTISVDDAASDDVFDPVPDQSVNVLTIDNDINPGIAITHTDGATIVTEAGSTDSFGVALTSQPSSNVVVSVISNDGTETTVSPATLTFTPANWNVAQSVTVTGVNDALDDGDIASNLTLSIVDALSDDPFDLVPDQTVSVTTSDDDVAGFVITQTDATTSVSEAGSTDSFSVVLTAQPTSNVELSIVSSDTTEVTVSAASLTFTPANWNVAQTVTVTGVNDDLDDGDVSSSVTISVVDAASDDTFDPLADQTVSVTTTDDDVGDIEAPTLLISPQALVTNASELTFTFAFSEEVTGFTISDIAITNGAGGDLTVVDPMTYMLAVTPASDGDVVINVAANAASDLAGNGSQAATATIVSDRTAPTADIVDITPDPRSAPVGVVTIQFGSEVVGVDINDFSLSRDGQEVPEFANLVLTGTGATYAIDLSTVTTVRGNYFLSLTGAGSEIADLAGNTLANDASDIFVIQPDALSVVLNNADTVRVARVGDNVEVRVNNVVAPQYAFLASTLKTISIQGGVGDNVIDLANVTRSAFPLLVGVTVLGNSGNDSINGSEFGDVFDGELGNDTINGGLGNDSLTGGSNNDVLNGGSGDDCLQGTSGNDVLTGGDGTDSLYGGTGSDVLREVFDLNLTLTNASFITTNAAGATVTDVVTGIELANLSGGTSRNRIDVSGFVATGFTTIAGNGGHDTIIGSPGADSILTGSGFDQINGGGGNDTVYSGSGNDTVSGGDGVDNLNGQNGDDSLLGDAGNDVLVGGSGVDSLNGGIGNDFLMGQTEAGLLTGGDGNDTLQGNTAADTLNGDAGDDKLFGLQNNDLLNGGDGNDQLFGGSGNDTLNGGAGLDSLSGEVGNDSLDGGADADRINETMDSDVTIVGLNLSSPVFGSDTAINIERINLLGGPAANRFDGRLASVNLLLTGDAGNDTLLGGSRNDFLSGGNGDDVLSGGAGTDTFVGGAGIDSVYERADTNFTVTGTRIVSAVTGDETATEIERIALVGGVGSNRLDAAQASVPVILLGGNGNDTLIGGALNDILIGGTRANPSSGTDSLTGNAGSDIFDNDPADTRSTDDLDAIIADVLAAIPSWVDQL